MVHRLMIQLRELADGFDVVLDDVEVSQIVFTVQLGITVCDKDRDYLNIIISSPFRIRKENDGEWQEIDPENEDPRLGDVVFVLRYKHLKRCHIAKSGTLALGFDKGLAIEVPPDAHYEAWDLDHKLFKIIATPGGELAVWDRAKGEKPQTT
jgi:hypothetical protein